MAEELKPIVLGPGAYGSPDPASSALHMLPISDDSVDAGTANLSKMKKPQLVALAESMELNMPEDATVAELREAIAEAREEETENNNPDNN